MLTFILKKEWYEKIKIWTKNKGVFTKEDDKYLGHNKHTARLDSEDRL